MMKRSKIEWLLVVSKIFLAVSEVLMIIYNLQNELREEETKVVEAD